MDQYVSFEIAKFLIGIILYPAGLLLIIKFFFIFFKGL